MLKKLPIFKANKKDQKVIIKIVDKILVDKKSGKDTKILEDKIDKMVYELYGLTDKEIEIVERGVK